MVFGGCLVNPIIQYWRCLFSIDIFRHLTCLKLEIALAIPALNMLNDKKYNRNNSAVPGLKCMNCTNIFNM